MSQSSYAESAVSRGRVTRNRNVYLFSELRICDDPETLSLYEECVLNADWRQWRVPVFALQRLWECDGKYKRWALDLLKSGKAVAPEAIDILRSMFFPARIPDFPVESGLELELLRRGGSRIKVVALRIGRCKESSSASSRRNLTRGKKSAERPRLRLQPRFAGPLARGERCLGELVTRFSAAAQPERISLIVLEVFWRRRSATRLAFA